MWKVEEMERLSRADGDGVVLKVWFRRSRVESSPKDALTNQGARHHGARALPTLRSLSSEANASTSLLPALIATCYPRE